MIKANLANYAITGNCSSSRVTKVKQRRKEDKRRCHEAGLLGSDDESKTRHSPITFPCGYGSAFFDLYLALGNAGAEIPSYCSGTARCQILLG